MDKFKSYHAAIRFLESFGNKGRERDARDPMRQVRRMRYFLALLGNPQKNIQFVHVTGTAGKGTVAHMIQNMLSREYKNVGLLTSPFATTTIEKISIDNLYIEPDEFVTIVNELKPYITRAYKECVDGGPNYFELIIAIGFLYFKKKQCTRVVCEVGCGGTHDATNVIEHTRVAVITNIDFDHTQILGRTLTKIAIEKAGIMKQGCAVFTAERRPHLQRIFKEAAKEKNATLRIVKYNGDASEQNKALARAVGGHLKIQEKNIEIGIAQTRLPCRFEIMQQDTLVILDGAHSPIKIKSVVDGLKNISYRRLILVVSIAMNKDINSMMKIIAPRADIIIATQFKIAQRKSVDPHKLARIASRYKKFNANIKVVADPLVALAFAEHEAATDDCVLATGSFFLVGDFRKKWYSEEWVLERRKSC